MATEAPQILKLVTVENPSSQILWIYPATNEAQEWIDKVAPDYGSYHPVDFSKKATLFVSRAYDIGAVKAYLESFGSSEADFITT